MTMNERWADVRSALGDAVAVTWDGCHKIYLILDRQQIREFDSYGYEMTHNDNPDDTLALLKEWYDASCFLRFVNSVRTDDTNPNDGYTNLIPQGAEEEEEAS